MYATHFASQHRAQSCQYFDVTALGVEVDENRRMDPLIQMASRVPYRRRAIAIPAAIDANGGAESPASSAPAEISSRHLAESM